MTREEFGAIAKKLKAVYAEPWFIPDKDAFDAWYALVRELDADKFGEAADRYMSEAEKPPTPGGILRYYREIEDEWKTLKRDLMDGWAILKLTYERHGGIVEPGTLRIYYEKELKELPREDQLDAFSGFVRDVYALMEKTKSLPSMEAYIRGMR